MNVQRFKPSSITAGLLILLGLYAPSLIANENQDLTLTYVGNAGFLLETGERKVLIDALVRNYNSRYFKLSPKIQHRLESAQSPFDGVDTILATHYHHDHFGPRAVAAYLAANPEASFLSTPQAVTALREEVAGFKALQDRIHATSPRDKPRQIFKDLDIEVLDMHHGLNRRPLVENNAYLMHLGEWTILHVGDTEVSPQEIASYDLKSRGIDVAMVTTWFLMEKGWEGVEQWRRVLEKTVQPGNIVLIHLAPNWRRDESASWVEAIAGSQDVLVFERALESKTLRKP